MSPTTTNITVDTQIARKKWIRMLVRGAPTIPVSTQWWYPSIPPMTLSRCVLWSQLRFLRVREPTRLVCVCTQSCPTLCGPMDCSPCAHAFVCVCVTPWIVARQASLFTGFSRQEYWSGFPCPPPGDLPNPGTEPASLALTTTAPGKPLTRAKGVEKQLG